MRAPITSHVASPSDHVCDRADVGESALAHARARRVRGGDRVCDAPTHAVRAGDVCGAVGDLDGSRVYAMTAWRGVAWCGVVWRGVARRGRGVRECSRVHRSRASVLVATGVRCIAERRVPSRPAAWSCASAARWVPLRGARGGAAAPCSPDRAAKQRGPGHSGVRGDPAGARVGTESGARRSCCPRPLRRLGCRSVRGPARRRRGRDVAQPGSAPEWGSGGRGFESRRPDVASDSK